MMGYNLAVQQDAKMDERSRSKARNALAGFILTSRSRAWFPPDEFHDFVARLLGCDELEREVIADLVSRHIFPAVVRAKRIEALKGFKENHGKLEVGTEAAAAAWVAAFGELIGLHDEKAVADLIEVRPGDATRISSVLDTSNRKTSRSIRVSMLAGIWAPQGVIESRQVRRGYVERSDASKRPLVESTFNAVCAYIYENAEMLQGQLEVSLGRSSGVGSPKVSLLPDEAETGVVPKFSDDNSLKVNERQDGVVVILTRSIMAMVISFLVSGDSPVNPAGLIAGERIRYLSSSVPARDSGDNKFGEFRWRLERGREFQATFAPLTSGYSGDALAGVLSAESLSSGDACGRAEIDFAIKINGYEASRGKLGGERSEIPLMEYVQPLTSEITLTARLASPSECTTDFELLLREPRLVQQAR